MNKIPFELTITSAHLQKNASFFTKTRAYTVVSLIGGDNIPCRTLKTPVDEDGGENPFWGSTMKFHLEELKLHGNCLMLVFMVRSKKTLSDKNLGFSYVPLKELFESTTGGGQNCPRNAAFLATTRSGKAKAVLYVSYKFGEVEKIGGKDGNIVGTTFAATPSAPPLPPGDSNRFVEAEEPIPSAPPYLEEDTDYYELQENFVGIWPS